MQREDSPGKERKLSERWVNWKRSLRLLYLRLLRLKGHPREVAGGMAIGVFVGMTPTVPLHTFLAVSIAFLLKKSKLAAAAGVWISNPLLLPWVYILDYKVGRVILGKNVPPFAVSDFSISHLIKLGWEISCPLFIGGFITGLLFAIPSFFIARQLILLYREKRGRRSRKVEFSSKTT
jgi:uncharacterized protein (DUF2062 family)